MYRDATKMILSGLIMAVLTYLPMKILDRLVFDTTRTIGLIILTGTVSLWGGFIYFLCAWIFNIEELKIFVAFLLRGGSWRKNLEKAPEIVAN